MNPFELTIHLADDNFRCWNVDYGSQWIGSVVRVRRGTLLRREQWTTAFYDHHSGVLTENPEVHRSIEAALVALSNEYLKEEGFRA